MCRFKCGPIRQHDCDWDAVNSFIDDVGAVNNEVAGGAGVAESSGCIAAVLWWSLGGGVANRVFVEGESCKIVTVARSLYGGGCRRWQTRQTRVFRFNCYIPLPSLSGLFWRRVGWHDDLVDVAFAAEMALRFVGRLVGASASFLVMVFAIVAGRACVPDGHVIPT